MKHIIAAFSISAFLGSISVCSALGQPLVFTPKPVVPAPKPAPMLHWAQFPVRVFVAAPSAAQRQEAQTVLAGLDEWVQASHGKVSYVLAAGPPDADIVVRFEPVRFLSAESESIGETTVTYSGLTLKKASIRLAEDIPVPADMQAAAAHEFGHALGIQSHSSDPNDLMYPREILHSYGLDDSVPSEIRTVTAHDLQTLKSCYPHWNDSSQATR